jgi:hypothetical protein
VLLSTSTTRVCVLVVALPYTPGFTCSRPLNCADCCGTLIGCSVRAVRHLRAVESKKKSLIKIHCHTKTRSEAGQSLPPIKPLLNLKINFRNFSTPPSTLNTDDACYLYFNLNGKQSSFYPINNNGRLEILSTVESG